MSVYLTRAFWLETADRAIKSGAQAVLLVIAPSDAGPINAYELNWILLGGFALGGVLISVLTSLLSAGAGTPGNASFLSIPGSTPPEAETVEGDGTGRALPDFDSTEERTWPPDEGGG